LRYLLDTCAFLWWADGDPKLSATAETAIRDRNNEIYLSTVSSWEIAIKVRIGKLVLAQSVSSYVADQITLNSFKLLTVELPHTFRVSTLPRHHDDPFDLLLIAQAQEEILTILTSDSEFPKYSVQILW
jgi:PIN domain nuclease of toxin-antitoxin system